eukprot:SAG11_NODE_2483_length_3304_cov_1.781903_4_plen_107_part_00
MRTTSLLAERVCRSLGPYAFTSTDPLLDAMEGAGLRGEHAEPQSEHQIMNKFPFHTHIGTPSYCGGMLSGTGGEKALASTCSQHRQFFLMLRKLLRVLLLLVLLAL